MVSECPITRDVITGYSLSIIGEPSEKYNPEALMHHLCTRAGTSPMTNAPIMPTDLLLHPPGIAQFDLKQSTHIEPELWSIISTGGGGTSYQKTVEACELMKKAAWPVNLSLCFPPQCYPKGYEPKTQYVTLLGLCVIWDDIPSIQLLLEKYRADVNHLWSREGYRYRKWLAVDDDDEVAITCTCLAIDAYKRGDDGGILARYLWWKGARMQYCDWTYIIYSSDIATLYPLVDSLVHLMKNKLLVFHEASGESTLDCLLDAAILFSHEGSMTRKGSTNLACRIKIAELLLDTTTYSECHMNLDSTTTTSNDDDESMISRLSSHGEYVLQRYMQTFSDQKWIPVLKKLLLRGATITYNMLAYSIGQLENEDPYRIYSKALIPDEVVLFLIENADFGTFLENSAEALISRVIQKRRGKRILYALQQKIKKAFRRRLIH